MALEVERVQRGSIAAQLGIEPGDVITHMGGEVLRDCIDSMYFEAEAKLLLSVRKKDGSVFEAEIEKEEYEPLGIEFVGDGLGKSRGCANHCVFCFVDQLPKGMRKTLYFKDDDWRMSFIMGNYITLTNVSEAEFERILARRTSPLYISVHATDDDLRAYLIGQERARGIMQRLTRLKNAGICFNCQVVCCPGLNDGAVLEKTISDLAGLYPACESLAIVPLGMTGHREGLAQLTPIGDLPRGFCRSRRDGSRRCSKSMGRALSFARTSCISGQRPSCRPMKHMKSSHRWRMAWAWCATSSGKCRMRWKISRARQSCGKFRLRPGWMRRSFCGRRQSYAKRSWV